MFRSCVCAVVMLLGASAAQACDVATSVVQGFAVGCHQPAVVQSFGVHSFAAPVAVQTFAAPVCVQSFGVSAFAVQPVVVQNVRVRAVRQPRQVVRTRSVVRVR